MYVVTVEFTIHAEHRARFMTLMLGNARRSRTDEPGCRQFDVCIDDARADEVFLYEIYDDRAAFDAHLPPGACTWRISPSLLPMARDGPLTSVPCLMSASSSPTIWYVTVSPLSGVPPSTTSAPNATRPSASMARVDHLRVGELRLHFGDPALDELPGAPFAAS